MGSGRSFAAQQADHPHHLRAARKHPVTGSQLHPFLCRAQNTGLRLRLGPGAAGAFAQYGPRLVAGAHPPVAARDAMACGGTASESVAFNCRHRGGEGLAGKPAQEHAGTYHPAPRFHQGK